MEKAMAPTPVFGPGLFMDSIVHGVTKSQTRLSDFHFQPNSKKAAMPSIKVPIISILKYLNESIKCIEKAMATHSIILACKIPWTEEPDGLQSMGSQKSPTWLRDQTTATEINELLHISGVYRALCVRSGGPRRKGNGGCMCYKMSSIFQNLCKGRSVVWNLAPPREIPPLPEHLAGNH